MNTFEKYRYMHKSIADNPKEQFFHVSDKMIISISNQEQGVFM